MTAQHDRDLRAAEDELASYRHLKASIARFIHDISYDREARIALAALTGLPRPTKEHTPWEAPASNGRRTSGIQLPDATESPTGAPTAMP